MDAPRIEVSLSQDKINLINGTHKKELKYWKGAALKMNLDEDKANRLKESPPSSFLLIRKPATNAKETDTDGIISYLKSKYSADNRYQIAFVKRYSSQEDVLSFEETSERLKAISKHIKANENMSLKIRPYLANGYYLQERYLDAINL